RDGFRTQAQGIPLWNPASVVEWNLDKAYLRHLGERGVSIPPTVWLEQQSEPNLSAILDEQGWEKAVVKPTVSATAFQTWITSPAQARSQQDRLEKLVETSGVMVQRFVDEIQTRGEWSLIFFHKEYSHAVLKRAKSGDFRVQHDFGGYLDDLAPSASLIEQAQRTVDLIEEPLLFARVDGVEIDGKFQLMELELIEPVLFLREDSLASQ
ncbi:MAG: ATP-grasp domain-containing protein, partial [Blastocatellia bacterium]